MLFAILFLYAYVVIHSVLVPPASKLGCGHPTYSIRLKSCLCISLDFSVSWFKCSCTVLHVQRKAAYSAYDQLQSKNIDNQHSKVTIAQTYIFVCDLFSFVYLYLYFLCHFRIQEDTGECHQWGYLRPLPQAPDLSRPGTDRILNNYLYIWRLSTTTFRLNEEYAVLYFVG